MKEDILKEFVSENFDSFNDQQPGSEVLNRIKSQLRLDEPVVASRRKVIKFQYWWAAAVLIFGITSIAYFEQNKVAETAIVSKAKSSIPNVGKDVRNLNPPPLVTTPKDSQTEPKGEAKRRKIKIKTFSDSQTDIPEVNIVAHHSEADLHSQSSSARLAAVLALGNKNNLLSDADLNTLFDIMNTDNNSNVRLTALDVLKRIENHSQVNSLILQSIGKQDDPYVQIELLASLSSEQAAEVKEQLVGLTRDTIHIEAVRDQAYAVLLRSNINF